MRPHACALQPAVHFYPLPQLSATPHVNCGLVDDQVKRLCTESRTARACIHDKELNLMFFHCLQRRFVRRRDVDTNQSAAVAIDACRRTTVRRRAPGGITMRASVRNLKRRLCAHAHTKNSLSLQNWLAQCPVRFFTHASRSAYLMFRIQRLARCPSCLAERVLSSPRSSTWVRDFADTWM